MKRVVIQLASIQMQSLELRKRLLGKEGTADHSVLRQVKFLQRFAETSDVGSVLVFDAAKRKIEFLQAIRRGKVGEEGAGDASVDVDGQFLQGVLGPGKLGEGVVVHEDGLRNDEFLELNNLLHQVAESVLRQERSGAEIDGGDGVRRKLEKQGDDIGGDVGRGGQIQRFSGFGLGEVAGDADAVRLGNGNVEAPDGEVLQAVLAVDEEVVQDGDVLDAVAVAQVQIREIRKFREQLEDVRVELVAVREVHFLEGGGELDEQFEDVLRRFVEAGEAQAAEVRLGDELGHDGAVRDWDLLEVLEVDALEGVAAVDEEAVELVDVFDAGEIGEIEVHDVVAGKALEDGERGDLREAQNVEELVDVDLAHGTDLGRRQFVNVLEVRKFLDLIAGKIFGECVTRESVETDELNAAGFDLEFFEDTDELLVLDARKCGGAFGALRRRS